MINNSIQVKFTKQQNSSTVTQVRIKEEQENCGTLEKLS